jgi:hypothetical protein
MPIDDRVRAHLRDLGAALNEAVSASPKVHEILAKVKAEGYDAYLVLDATVALDRRGRRASAALPSIRRGAPTGLRGDGETATFKIDVKDLNLLRSLGIDPTRPVRARRRPEATVTMRSTVSRKG